MKRDFRILLGLLLSATMIISCERDDTESYDLSEQTSVSLSINVDDMESGTATRSSIKADDNDGISSEVKSLWIAQCNGAADTSKVLMAHYVADVTATNALDLTFIQSAQETTMVYIANVNQTIGEGDDVADLITVGMTLKDLKALSPTLSAPTSANQLYTSGLVNKFSNTEYFVMNGYELLKDGINSTTPLTASLKRNAVKITINLLNQWHDSEIKGVTLMSAADTTEYALCQYDFDAYATNGTHYPTSVTTPIDHFETELSIAGNIFASDDEEDDDTVSVNFYIPANMRGTDSSSTEEATKPTYAPAGATYIVIRAEDEYEYFYTYYLGANLIDDYNLKPNYHYTYDITFTGVGNVGGDVRIEGIVVNDYSNKSSSNCYIINGSDDYVYKYYIPIEDRITDFWTNYDYNSTYDTDALTEALTDCTYDILWTDNTTDPFNESTNAIDQIEIDIVKRDEKQCLEVIVPKGFNNWGNVLVAVTDTSDDANILWSWHLWITDYNPYSDIVKVDDNYYTVDGGYLHRYGDDDDQSPAIWGSGGTYDGKYIMDRNIGAKVANAAESSGNQGLYYQYGRKDPFESITIESYSANIEAAPKGLDYSVKNPTAFIAGSSTTSYNWCGEDTDTNYTWNDRNAPYSTTSPIKSIFDPSPYGYCVPIINIWDGDVFNKPNGTFSGTYNYAYHYGNYSLIGSFLNNNISVYWSSTSNTEEPTRSYMFNHKLDNVEVSYNTTGYYRACGCSVRCIQE